jgi:hypothetical protein
MREIRTKHKWRRLAVVTLLVGCGVSVCVSEAAEQSAPAQVPASQPLVARPPAHSPVPPRIAQVAELGENLYDALKAADWPKATARFRSMRQATNSLVAELGIGRPELPRLRSAMASLKEAIPSRNRPVALQEANEITLIAANLSAAYNPTVPADVARLDYYGRALEIWSGVGDTKKLAEIAQEIRRTWDSLRPSLAARGGSSEIAPFNGLVARLEAANSPSMYAEIAGLLLDAVDGIEKVFSR